MEENSFSNQKEDISKEKEKSLTPEEDDHTKSLLKDDTSERSHSISGSNSFQKGRGSLLSNIRNSATDLDKIIAGKDESRLNSNETQDKEEKRESDDNKNINININLNLGNFKERNARRNTIKIERVSMFKNMIEEKDKGANLKDIINAQLNEIKTDTLNFFLQIAKEFEKRYVDYMDKIKYYVENNENKINKVFQQNNDNNENMLEFAENNIFQQVENLLEIHENIFNAIEDHISLLGTFLEKPDLIKQKNPLEFFINNCSDSILNCWFMNKINIQKLNIKSFESNKELLELYSKFLIKKKNNSVLNFIVAQDSKGHLSAGEEFIKQNLKNFEKLKFLEVKGEEINKIFKCNKKVIKDEDITSTKLKSLYFTECDFSSIDLNKIIAPSLKKLKIKRASLPISLSNFLDSILIKSSFLQNLCLQKCGIDDDDLSNFFEYIVQTPKLVESLQNLSFYGNQISIVDMKILIENNLQFKNLESIDFSKNNIFEFCSENFKLLQNIKLLDLSDNNLTNYAFFENVKGAKNIKSILLLSNNMFLTNNKNNNNIYLKYLHDKLSNYKSKLKKLKFSFLYDKGTRPIILNLKLSPTVKISLIKLNLSYCGLDNDTICKFLNNNFGLLNLKILNLSSNFIDLKFFELIKNIDLSLDKLACLDLSLNEILDMTINDYQNIELFINKHPNIKKMKFQETLFLKDLLSLLQNESDKCAEINRNLINKEFKFIVEKASALEVESVKELFELKDKEI